STGEDIPRGQSLVARLWATEVKQGDVIWERLTVCQERRRQGVFAEAMSAFVQWLATDNRIEKFQKEASKKIHELRVEWSKSGVDAHKKTANTLAQFQRAWEIWLTFASECGAIKDEEQVAVREAVAAALDEG